jgi:hypothetical protein
MGMEVLYSYGVGTNSAFELMFCQKHNAIARLYDHTFDTMPLKEDFLHFNKQGFGVKNNRSLDMIENHINENADVNKKLILKIDVEGAEWDTLLHKPNATFMQTFLNEYQIISYLSRSERING